MKVKVGAFILIFIIIIAFISFGFKANEGDKSLHKTTTNAHYNFIAINQILMWVSNNGDGSHDPVSDGGGFYWPGGREARISAIFEDGLIWGGKIGREIRVNGNTHRQGLQAGKIRDDGTPENAADPRFRVYKIRKGWESLPPGAEKSAYERDYNEWPVEDGAPWVDVDNDGIFTRGVDEPQFVGDEVLWYVSNDLDEAQSIFTYGSPSIGLEFQTTIFGFNRTGDLGDILFKKYLIINKSPNKIKDMIIAYWSDTDLGKADDDATGCDTVLSLGYTYNFDNNDDGSYGTPPPAVGYDFFQGPIVPASPLDSAKFLGKWKKGYKNLGLTAFTLYANGYTPIPDPRQGDYNGTLDFYNYMSGKLFNGEPFIDPFTGAVTKFVVPGDPTQNPAGGWHQLNWPNGPGPQDMRHVMASGPFTMAPGDTQEVVVGLIIARGKDHLDSVHELKRKDSAAQIAYNLDFNLTPPPPNPTVHFAEADRSVTLYWDPNAESYDAGDPLIFGRGFTDTTFTFEGYRVWQFSDITGADAELLAVFDLKNGIKVIKDYVVVNGENVLAPVISGSDNGLQYQYKIEIDKYTSARLRNGSPYYFAITSYGYSANSSPTFLESPPQIIEIFPQTKKIEFTPIYKNGENIQASHDIGTGEGFVEAKVFDEEMLTGDTYKVKFHGTAKEPSYSFFNTTKSDTLIVNSNNFVVDTVRGMIFDGMMLKIVNTGKLMLDAAPKRDYKIREILETKGPGGVDIASPVDVSENMNSTYKWKITSYVLNQTIEPTPAEIKFDIDWQNKVGYNSYEIRFTSSGSEYYLTGYKKGTAPALKDDFKAKDKVPFEIWNLGKLRDASDDVRLIIKVLDFTYSPTTFETKDVLSDSTWSQLPSQRWEPIFAYYKDAQYQEPLPDKSGTSAGANHFIGRIIFEGDMPEAGTVIRINTWVPLAEGDEFSFVATKPNISDLNAAKTKIDNISVFPNPYFGANPLERDKYQRFVRFTNLPTRVNIKIFSLAGVLVTTLDENNKSEPNSQFLDWNLRNRHGLPVASGLYIAYLEMPGIGTKVLKIAVIMETQFIDRL